MSKRELLLSLFQRARNTLGFRSVLVGTLLAALVLIPWALDGVFIPGRARVGSLPGLLGFVADLASQMGAAP